MSSTSEPANPTYVFHIPVYMRHFISPVFNYRGPETTRDDLAEMIQIFHPSIAYIKPEFTKEKLTGLYEELVIPFLVAPSIMNHLTGELSIYYFNFDFHEISN